MQAMDKPLIPSTLYPAARRRAHALRDAAIADAFSRLSAWLLAHLPAGRRSAPQAGGQPCHS